MLRYFVNCVIMCIFSLLGLTTENNGMPAPKELPLRLRKIKTEPLDLPKRSARSRKKPERYGETDKLSNMKSDVIIENSLITTIEQRDGLNKQMKSISQSKTLPQLLDQNQNEELQVKTTRTMVIEKQTVEEEKSNKKEEMNQSNKDKTRTSSESNKSGQTEYEDAVSDLDILPPSTNANTTFAVIDKPLPTFELQNATFVLEKCKENQVDVKNIDSEKTPLKKNEIGREIFSPYDKTSIKSRIKTFEKVASKTASSPSVSSKIALKPNEEENGSRFKQNFFTPTCAKTLPKTQSTSKIHRYIERKDSSANQSTLLSFKSHSALKTSQMEYTERVKCREEALKKREAQLQKITEEKRRKREEKQLKAQQQRETLEKEKQKKLKEEEEKQKQLMEEKLQKQKEENERKMQITKQKEEKRKKILEAEKLSKQEKWLPVYMTSKAPLLPTDDCYDSDHDEHTNTKGKALPEWSRESNLRRKQITIIKIGEKIKNTFFCRSTHSPNLQEIFENIDYRKLQRTSSAIWKKPPRYTVFLESSSVHFSEDDE